MSNPQDKAESDEDLAQMIIGHGPCTYLLLLLLGFILLSPYLEEGIFARTLLGILFSIVLLVGAFATRQTSSSVRPNETPRSLTCFTTRDTRWSSTTR